MNPRKTLLLAIGAVVELGCVNPNVADHTMAANTTDMGESRACEPDAAIGLTVGMCAPDFSMPNRDGVAMTLYSERGKVALVDISAIW